MGHGVSLCIRICEMMRNACAHPLPGHSSLEAPQGDVQLRQRVQQMLEDQRRQLDALQHEISED